MVGGEHHPRFVGDDDSQGGRLEHNRGQGQFVVGLFGHGQRSKGRQMVFDQHVRAHGRNGRAKATRQSQQQQI